MLRSGVQTDIRTGRPVEVNKEDVRKARAQEQFTRSILEASEMSASLHQNNAVLKVWLIKYDARLKELADNDPALQAMEAPIDEIRSTLEVLPLLRERRAMRVVGPQLASIVIDET